MFRASFFASRHQIVIHIAHDAEMMQACVPQLICLRRSIVVPSIWPSSVGKSLSSVIAELATYGLSQLKEPLVLRTDPQSGFPVASLGRQITSEDVASALDDE
jgi:hypothetical protein